MLNLLRYIEDRCVFFLYEEGNELKQKFHWNEDTDKPYSIFWHFLGWNIVYKLIYCPVNNITVRHMTKTTTN
jgi:hypothetical protein